MEIVAQAFKSAYQFKLMSSFQISHPKVCYRRHCSDIDQFKPVFKAKYLSTWELTLCITWVWLLNDGLVVEFVWHCLQFVTLKFYPLILQAPHQPFYNYEDFQMQLSRMPAAAATAMVIIVLIAKKFIGEQVLRMALCVRLCMVTILHCCLRWPLNE